MVVICYASGVIEYMIEEDQSCLMYHSTLHKLPEK